MALKQEVGIIQIDSQQLFDVIDWHDGSTWDPVSSSNLFFIISIADVTELL